MNVGVIGLGKLGAPLAATLADKHNVWAFDLDRDAVKRLEMPVHEFTEPDVRGALLKAHATGQIHPCYEVRPLVEEAEVIFIIVPTPSNPDGSFSTVYVRQAISNALVHVDDDMSRTLVIVSTLSPGTCDEQLQPMLAEYPYVSLVYNPTLIAINTVMRDLAYPDVTLLGARQPIDADKVLDVWWEVAATPHKWHVGSFAEIELAKLSINAYVTLKLTFANRVGWMCHKLGANVDTVLNAIGDDKRIGRGYLKAGGSFGGPCFPRDNRAFQQAAGGVPTLATEVESLNALHATEIAQLAMPDSCRFIVLGMEYKDGVSLEERSFGHDVERELLKRGGVDVERLEDAEVVILAQPHQSFDCDKLKPGVRVVDVWRAYRDLGKDENVDYVPFGG